MVMLSIDEQLTTHGLRILPNQYSDSSQLSLGSELRATGVVGHPDEIS
jgi:hypothetical protein